MWKQCLVSLSICSFSSDDLQSEMFICSSFSNCPFHYLYVTVKRFGIHLRYFDRVKVTFESRISQFSLLKATILLLWTTYLRLHQTKFKRKSRAVRVGKHYPFVTSTKSQSIAFLLWDWLQPTANLSSIMSPVCSRHKTVKPGQFTSLSRSSNLTQISAEVNGINQTVSNHSCQ